MHSGITTGNIDSIIVNICIRHRLLEQNQFCIGESCLILNLIEVSSQNEIACLIECKDIVDQSHLLHEDDVIIGKIVRNSNRCGIFSGTYRKYADGQDKNEYGDERYDFSCKFRHNDTSYSNV